MTDSQTLLVDYARHGSDAAFRELVARYLNLVYSTAVRFTGGDTHLAEDVAQTVFIDLARLAKGFSAEVKLGGWLHRHTCFVAAKTLRGERRRQFRERQAVEMNMQPDHSQVRLNEIAPVLDEAINQLGEADRAAVLLRFYEQLDFRSVGQALGINESAAQKRVTRALEKLHVLLKGRAVGLSVAALGVALAGEAVSAAPAELAASIAGTALAGAGTGIGNTFTIFKLMASTKLKASLAAAVVAASVLTPWLLQRQAQARLDAQNAIWLSQSNQLAQLSLKNARLAETLARGKSSIASSPGEFREMLRLRGEVGLLKSHVQQLTAAKITDAPEDQIAALAKMYASRVALLKQWLDAHPSQKIPELSRITDATWLGAVESLETQDELDFEIAARTLRSNAQGQVLDQLYGGLRQYGAANNGEFPTTLAQLQPYLATPIDNEILQGYEIVPTKSLVPELQPGGAWAITETAPVDPDLDGREAIGLTNMAYADERITNRWASIQN